MKKDKGLIILNATMFFIGVCAIMLYTLVCVIALADHISAKFEEFGEKSCKKDMKEYQVELDMDTVRVYQYGRYVDCYIIEDGKLNQFDEICAMDNR